MGCGRINRRTVGKGRYLKDTLCYGIMHKVYQHYDNCVDFGYPGRPSGISDLKPEYLTVLEKEDSPHIRPIQKLDCRIKTQQDKTPGDKNQKYLEGQNAERIGINFNLNAARGDSSAVYFA